MLVYRSVSSSDSRRFTKLHPPKATIRRTIYGPKLAIRFASEHRFFVFLGTPFSSKMIYLYQRCSTNHKAKGILKS